MKKFIIISAAFEGWVEYGFDKTGYLIHFRIGAWALTEEQHSELLQGLGQCLHWSHFKTWVRANGYLMQEVAYDLSFETGFWPVYGNTRNRVEAEKEWQKLNDEDRHWTLINHEAFSRYCAKNTWYNKMYAERYIRSNRRDDWDKVITGTKPKGER